jgi:hypothetical protein
MKKQLLLGLLLLGFATSKSGWEKMAEEDPVTSSYGVKHVRLPVNQNEQGGKKNMVCPAKCSRFGNHPKGKGIMWQWDGYVARTNLGQSNRPFCECWQVLPGGVDKPITKFPHGNITKWNNNGTSKYNDLQVARMGSGCKEICETQFSGIIGGFWAYNGDDPTDKSRRVFDMRFKRQDWCGCNRLDAPNPNAKTKKLIKRHLPRLKNQLVGVKAVLSSNRELVTNLQKEGKAELAKDMQKGVDALTSMKKRLEDFISGR